MKLEIYILVSIGDVLIVDIVVDFIVEELVKVFLGSGVYL